MNKIMSVQNSHDPVDLYAGNREQRKTMRGDRFANYR